MPKRSRRSSKTPNSRAQSYRSLNRAALGLVLYLLAQPLLFLRINPFLPDWITTCGSIRYFGRPCPLCGLTRGLHALLSGRVMEACSYNVLSVPVLVLMGLEFCYRIYGSFARISERQTTILARVDRRLHILLLACYIIYSAWFYTQ